MALDINGHMMTATFDDLLAALSARTGLPLADNDGVCAFCIDDRPVSIQFDEESERVVVTALVANDLPANPSRQLVIDLLNLGFGMVYDGLPAVGRDPDLGFITAFLIFSGARLNAAEFPDEFEKFVAFALNLAKRIDSEREGGALELPAENAAPGDAPASPGFLRV